MLRVLVTVIVGACCFAAGLCVGVWKAAQLKTTEPARQIQAIAAKVPVLSADSKPDPDSPFESYEYPTIKWRAKSLSDADGAIGRLWTTYEPNGSPEKPGLMKYKLTLFKATNKSMREVQLLDAQGFKLLQFQAGDFHDIPGAADVIEARDGVACQEDVYKKAQDYSIK
jgi:hypothetical protein